MTAFLARSLWLSLILLSGCEPGAGGAENAPHALRSVAEFASIADQSERSQALFTEAARVLLHPRCVNCHPSDNSPRQMDNGQIHVPPVVRGPKGEGVPAMMCTSCHQDQTIEHADIPGAAHWHLAPVEMAWLGKTPQQVCEQLKDLERNGGRDAAALVKHVEEDPLVAWGWNPGPSREPVPGDQETFARLIEAWLETGAVCPTNEPQQQGAAS